MNTNTYGYVQISSENGKKNCYQLKPGNASIGTIHSADIRLKIKNAIPTIFCTINVKDNGMAMLEKKYGVILLNGKKVGKSAVSLRNEDCFQVGEKIFTYMNDSLKITTSQASSYLKHASRRSVMPNFKINSRSKIPAINSNRPITRRSLSVNCEEPKNNLISKRSCISVSERKYRRKKNDNWETSEAGNVLPGRTNLLRESLFLKNIVNTSIQNTSNSHEISINLNFETSLSLSASQTTSKTNGTPSTTGKLNRKSTQHDQRLSEPGNLRRRSLRNSVRPLLNFNEEPENEEQNEIEQPTSPIMSTPLKNRRLLGQCCSTGKIDTRKGLVSKLKRQSLRHSVSKLQNLKVLPLNNMNNDLQTSKKSIDSLIIDSLCIDDSLDEEDESSDNLVNLSGVKSAERTPEHTSFKEFTNTNEGSPAITLNTETNDSEISAWTSDQSQSNNSTIEESPMKTPKLEKSSLNDSRNVFGIRRLLKTRESPLNDGVKKLLQSTKKIQKTPKNDLTDVRGVKQLLRSSRKAQKSPENDLTNVHGVKKLFSFATREEPKTPLNDLSDLRGVKQLLKSSRKEEHSPENDLTNVHGVKKLFSFADREEPKTPLNDLSDLRGVKQLLKSSRKREHSPENDLTNVHGVKKLFSFATREEPKTPLNDLSDLRGVKQLLKSSRKEEHSPENDLTNVHGVKKLFSFATREEPKTPLNDLSDVCGVKQLLKSSRKAQKSPENDLTNVHGVKKLFSTRQAPKTPLNDLRDVRGVKKLLKSARKEQKSPQNDLTDVPNLQELFETSNYAGSSNNYDELDVNKTDLNRSHENDQSPKEMPVTPTHVDAMDLFDSLREETHNTFARSAAPKVYKASKHIYKSPENDLRRISGIDTLFQTPKMQVSLMENRTNTSHLQGLEDSVREEKPKRTLRTRRKLHSEKENIGLIESDVNVTNNSNITDSVLLLDEQKTKRTLRGRKRMNTDNSEPAMVVPSSAQESVAAAADVEPEKLKRGRKNTNKTVANDDNTESVVKDESTPNISIDVNAKPKRNLRGRKKLNPEDTDTETATPVKRSQRLKVKFDVESDVEQLATPKREPKEDVKPKRGGRKNTQKTEIEIEEKPKRGRKKKDDEDVIIGEKQEKKPKRGRKKQVAEQLVEENVKQEEKVLIEEKPKRGRKKKIEEPLVEENVKQVDQVSSEQKPKRGRKKQTDEGSAEEKPKRARKKPATEIPVEEKPKREGKKENEEGTIESAAEPVERVTRSTRSRRKL